MRLAMWAFNVQLHLTPLSALFFLFSFRPSHNLFIYACESLFSPLSCRFFFMCAHKIFVYLFDMAVDVFDGSLAR